MKKRSQHFSFVMATFCASITTLRAQWGIRYILPQTETSDPSRACSICGSSAWASISTSAIARAAEWTLMIDTNWNDHTARDRAVEPPPVLHMAPPPITTEKLKVYGLQYRSQFHFSDNDRTSVYVGSTLGIRYLRQTVTGDVYTNSSSNSGNYDTVIASGNGVL
jgi:hypothetical protein